MFVGSKYPKNNNLILNKTTLLAVIQSQNATSDATLDWRVVPGAPTWRSSQWHGPKPVDPASAEWNGTVAICAMMKKENQDDVVEWLLYHKCAFWTL